MANPGCFKKGEKRPNQGKRGPSKATKQAREAISMFVENNTERLQGWLDDIAADDPKAAFDRFMNVVEYHIPKLQRTEHVGDGGGPVKVVASSKDEDI